MSERDIFDRALEIEDLARRAEFLDQACADDLALREHLAELLAMYGQVGRFLESPVNALATTIALKPAFDCLGTVIGSYKLLEEIGEGGMGLVFVAEQQQPIRRKVALKVIKPGMDSRAVVARFEAERQALALMDHPNIARVFDAGTTEHGRPYFVMEIVHGVPITEHCDDNRLTPRERLELFVHVCQAVQHAHQKGIIHRDLKPSNVLATLHDGISDVKVIDFGVAKAIGQQLTEKTIHTRFSQMIGTPLYMSPEQAEMSGLDADTRTDIYSLGVLLYELLTGTTPFDKERLSGASYDEMRRIIREEEPPKPSTRIGTLGQATTVVATNRKTDPKRLGHMIHGELDWIVMKCLEKDRDRRYETANGVALDIRRYLDNEPVQAFPPSTSYRVRKFALRHRRETIAAGVVAAILIVGVIGITWQAVRATLAERRERIAADAERAARSAETLQRQQSETVATLLESVFRDLDPHSGGDLRSRLAQRLEEVGANLAKEHAGEPLVLARLRHALGSARYGLGDPTKAVPLLEQALEERRLHLGADHPDTLQTMHALALAYHWSSQLDKATALHEQTLEIYKINLGQDHPDTFASANGLIRAYLSGGQPQKALVLAKQTTRLAEAAFGTGHPIAIKAMHSLADAYLYSGDREKATELHRRTLELCQVELEPDDDLTLSCMLALADTYRESGKFAKALPVAQQALERHKAKFGHTHPDTLVCMDVLANVYRLAGEPDKALDLAEQMVTIRKDRSGSDHLDTLIGIDTLAMACHEAGQHTRAISLLREILPKLEAQCGPDHPWTLTSINHLAAIHTGQGECDRAEPLLTKALSAAERKLGPAHPQTGELKENLELSRRVFPAATEYRQALSAKGGDHLDTLAARHAFALKLRELSQFGPAGQHLQKVLEARRRIQGAGHPDTLACQIDLAVAGLQQKKYAEVEPLLLQAYEELKKAPGIDVEKIRINALERLVQLYDEWGKKDQVTVWRKDLESLNAR
jgi:serine/threonine protein kinase/tetratricopeptide (TPR) repeat protein